MTKLSEVLQKARGARDNNFFKFTNYKPNHAHMKIRRIPMLSDTVRVENDKGLSRAQCLPEMFKMFNCWNRTDYAQGSCVPEIDTFEQCILVAEDRVREMRKLSATPELGIDSKKAMNSSQVNTLLHMYPQPKFTIKITHRKGKPIQYDPFVHQYPLGYLRERSNNNKY